MSNSKSKNLTIRNGTFYARLWIGGREVRRSLSTASRTVALKRLAEVRAEIEATPATAAPQAGRTSYADAVVQWDETFLRGGSVRPRTAQSYRQRLKALHPVFGFLYLDQIDRRTIAAFVAQRRKEGVTNATIRRGLTALSSILTFACAMGQIDTNPAREWDRRVIRETREPQRPPTAEQIETVLTYANPAKAAVIRAAAATGMRLNELTRLEWRDIDMRRGTITLVRTKTGRPRIIRMVTAGGDAETVLRAVPRHVSQPWVFWHSADGQRYTQLSRGFADLVRRVVRDEAALGRAFQRFRFHDLRHAFAIGWLDSGGDIYELSRHLGHTSVKTTEMYLQWMDPDARDRYERRAPSAEQRVTRGADDPGPEPDQTHRFRG